MTGKIITEHGTMVVEFFKKDAPNTVNNFAKLAKMGFYEGLKFHRDIIEKIKEGETFSVEIVGGEEYPEDILVETQMKTGTF